MIRRRSFFAVAKTGAEVASEHFKKGVPKHLISSADIATFDAQYPKLAVRYNESFHDCFLITDDKEQYLINVPKKREPCLKGRFAVGESNGKINTGRKMPIRIS